MDGSSKIVSYSLQKKLTRSLSLLVILIGVIAGCYNFYSTMHNAKEWQDNYLQQIINIYQSNEKHWFNENGQIFSANDEIETNLYIKKIAVSQPNFEIENNVLFKIPLTFTKGLHTIQGSNDTYRVVIHTFNSGEKLVVAQSTIERNELAAENAFNALIPIFLLIPLIVVLLRKYIAYLFMPIKKVSSAINKDQYNDFTSIPISGIPEEIQPFILSINQLLSRVATHISMQQQFIAEAAHELRSPLTALSLQAERLENLVTSKQAICQLKVLRTGIERNRELVSQLLTLAKVQSNKTLIFKDILLTDIVKKVIEEILPLAEQKSIDIGVVESCEAHIKANENELIILFRNLIENAIKYSHDNGVIDISINQKNEQIHISILDCGPGISLTEIDHVFSPFYRGSNSDTIGTGLGLSIVKSIIEKLKARIEMKNIDNVGFKVTVIFNTAIL
jgi:two-component system OmpR family sensor kinase